MPAAASPITRQTVGKTFIVAISVLGFGAFLQLGAIGWMFYSRFQTTPATSSAVAVANEPAGLGKDFQDPFDNDERGAVPTGGPSRAPGVIPARPVPDSQFAFRPVPINPEKKPESAREDAQDNSRFAELIQQARTLRERGDGSTAVIRFREALALEPQNPMPLAEIASTYEKMGVADKAAEHWRKIYDLGEGAGVYFTAAEAKMKASQVQALMQAMPPTNVQDLEAAQIAARPATGGSEGQSVGMFPTSKLGFGDLAVREESEYNSSLKMVLRVPVRAKSRARIDVSDVTIQVIFYDILNERTLDKTNAEVSTRWASPPADWADDDVEILEVTYRPLPPAQGEAIENRKFYGYLARVYYKDALQDARAQPTRLGQTYPAPRMLQPDSTP